LLPPSCLLSFRVFRAWTFCFVQPLVTPPLLTMGYLWGACHSKAHAKAMEQAQPSGLLQASLWLKFFAIMAGLLTSLGCSGGPDLHWWLQSLCCGPFDWCSWSSCHGSSTQHQSLTRLSPFDQGLTLIEEMFLGSPLFPESWQPVAAP